MKPSSGDWTVLTRRGDVGSVSKVCWSRDGDKLFFDRVSDVPRGIFSVPPLGGEERSILEDAQGPEALPDGSLLVVKRDAARNFQIHRFRPDTGALEPVGTRRRRRGRKLEPARLPRWPDGDLLGPPGGIGGPRPPRLSPGRRRPGKSPRSRRSFRWLLRSRSARTESRSSRSSTSATSSMRSPCRVDGEESRILFPVTGKPWGLDSGAGGSLFVSTMDSPAELLRFSPAGGVPDQVVTMAGNLATSPVELPDGGMLVPNQILGRRRLVISAPDGQIRPFLDSAEQATPPATRVGEDLVAFLSGTRRTASAHHDREDPRGTHRAPARGRRGASLRRASSRRPTAGRSTTSTRDPSLRSESREAPRGISVPPTASRSIRTARARPSSSRSTRSTGSSCPVFRSTEAPNFRFSSRARSSWRPSRSPDRPSARTAGSRSLSPRPTRCSAASPSSTRSTPPSSAFP